jgi:drug/metabolite transporter (DMT)-like permease
VGEGLLGNEPRATGALTVVPRARGKRAALLALVLVNLVWGGSMPATKLGLAEFSPFVLSWLRLALSALLFAALIPRQELRALSRRDWLNLLGLGIIGYSGTIGLQSLGTNGTTGASAAVLGSTGPVFIALCAFLLLRERPKGLAVAGLLVALVGVALVLGLDPSETTFVSAQHVGGDLLVLGSAACFGIFTVVGKNSLGRHSPIAVSGVTCLGGVLGLTLPAALELATGLPRPSLLGWGVIAYLGAVVTFAGMLAYFWALRAVPASRGGALLFLQPVSGIVLAALLLGDAVSQSFLLGTGLVLAGLYLVIR